MTFTVAALQPIRITGTSCFNVNKTLSSSTRATMYSGSAIEKGVKTQRCLGVAVFLPLLLLLVLLLGAVLQDPRELDIVEEAALDRRLPVHLVDVLGGNSIGFFCPKKWP